MKAKKICNRILAAFLFISLSQQAIALSVKDSTVFAKPVFVIDWIDNDGKPRKVAMVKDSHPQSTGVCVLIQYYDGTTPVTITSTTPNDDIALGKPWNVGFGCTVHHNMTYHNGGTLTKRFQGDHIAIFDWVQTLDGSIETVTYTFMDGLDYFQWQETVDARAGTIAGDSRGPYCTMQWDGVDFSSVTGQEYSAEKYFVQNSYNGAWTLSGDATNDIPYVLQWDNSREVGFVQTQTFNQQLAGAPNWGGSWNLSSSGIRVDGFGGAYSAPTGDEDWAFDYQMNFYDGAKKITWGMPYGYMNNGGGTGVNNGGSTGNKSGWGQYSLSIIFDAMAENGVRRITNENRAIHNGTVSLAAVKGTVVTTGPVGTANPATQTLSPAGYDHNYRTWWVTADVAGETEMTMATGASTLKNPTFRIKNMTALPSEVRFNGALLTVSTDYYASYNSSTQEAWVTIKRDFTGNNTVYFKDGTPVGIVISAASVTPATVINNVSNNLTFAVTATDDGAVTGITLDLTSIGGGAAVAMTAGIGDTWTHNYNLAAGASTGTKTIVATVTDNLGNTKTVDITLAVNPNVSYLNIYTDASTMVTGSYNGNGTLVEQTGAGASEGSEDYFFSYTAVGWYAGFGLNFSNWSDAQAKDFSSYDYLELSYSGPTAGTGIAITLSGTGGTASTAYTVPFSATYTTVQIPLSSFGVFNLSQVVGLGFAVTGTQTGTGSMRLDNIRLGDNNTLPVDYHYFTVTLDRESLVKLNWATSLEENNDKFVIERSIDGIFFLSIGEVSGHNGKSLTEYSFVDNNPHTGITYYRIKQIDLNGEYTYSVIRSLERSQGLKVYFSGQDKKLVLSGKDSGLFEMTIWDANGRKLGSRSIVKENTSYEVFMTDLQTGFYIILIENASTGSAIPYKCFIW